MGAFFINRHYIANTNFKNTINIYLSIVLTLIYIWFIQDIFEIFFFKELILQLEGTVFLKILQCLFLVFVLLNTTTLFIICEIEKWSLLMRVLFAFILIILNGIILQTVYLSLLWNEGGLAVMLTHSDIINNSHFFGPKTLNEILPQLYQSYGLNISWCNPTIPRFLTKQFDKKSKLFVLYQIL